MFPRYSTEVIVLGGRDYLEADKQFTLFSKEFGLVEVMGKSIRKIGSKLRGEIAPFSLSLVEFIQGHRYNILVYSEELDGLPGLKSDLVKMRVGYKMRDVFLGLVQGQERDDSLWEHLTDGIFYLDGSSLSTNSLYLFYFHFVWRLLCLMGYRPDFYDRDVYGDAKLAKSVEKMSRTDFVSLDISKEDIVKLERVIEASLPGIYNGSR